CFSPARSARDEQAIDRDRVLDEPAIDGNGRAHWPAKRRLDADPPPTAVAALWSSSPQPAATPMAARAAARPSMSSGPLSSALEVRMSRRGGPGDSAAGTGHG